MTAEMERGLKMTEMVTEGIERHIRSRVEAAIIEEREACIRKAERVAFRWAQAAQAAANIGEDPHHMQQRVAGALEAADAIRGAPADALPKPTCTGPATGV